jgi:hypothetical protein
MARAKKAPVSTPPTCERCGAFVHAGECYRVAVVEYHPDGTLKRIEYYPSSTASEMFASDHPGAAGDGGSP